MAKSKSTAKLLTRRQIRIKVLQASYAVITSENSPYEVFNSLLEPDYKLLLEITASQEEDRTADADFLKRLFFESTSNKIELEKIIVTKLENWEIDRIALMDRIILVLATCEMLTFPEIPIKVTINEYIDLAKAFSTDKSSQFVNGVLDAIFTELERGKQIQKSGRGLIGGALQARIREPEDGF